MVQIWIILTLFSAFLFGIKDILAKKFLNKNIEPNQILFEQNFLILLIILIIFFPKIKLIYSINLIFWIFIKASVVSIAMLIYFQLLEKYEISNISPLLNLSPIILLFLSFIFLGELISFYQFLGILITIFATYFLEITIKNPKLKEPNKSYFLKLKKLNIRYLFKIFIMLLAISIAAISDKIILKTINVYTNLFFTSLIIFFLMFLYYLKNNNLKSKFILILKEPETLIISLFTIISNFLVVYAISIPSALVSLIVPLRRTSTLFSSLFGGFIFHEKHLIQKIIAIIFMLFGIYLIVF